MLPPQVPESERIVLGSALVDRQCWELALHSLDTSDFYSGENRKIFAALCRYPFGANRSVDLVRLADSMPEPDPVYLAELCESSMTAGNLPYHIEQVKEMSGRRKRIAENQEEISKLYDPDEPFSIPQLPLWTAESLNPARFFSTPPAEVSFIVDKLLVRSIVGFIYGEGGGYKSLSALWLAVVRACAHIDNMLLWLDRFPVQQGKTVFISAEDVEYDLHVRLPRIVEVMHRARPEIPIEAYQKAISENILIISREQWTRDGELFLIDENGKETGKYSKVVELVRGFQPELVIIETLSRISNADENDNKAAARVVGVLERLRDDTGATVLCIAHTSKMNRGGKTDTHGQNSMRGAGAFLDNARFGLWFKAIPKQDGKDCIEIINSKTFRTQRADAFKVSVDFPVFKVIEDATNSVFDAVVEYVRQHPGAKQREIREGVKGNMSAIGRALKDAIDEGIIINRGKREGYFLNE